MQDNRLNLYTSAIYYIFAKTEPLRLALKIHIKAQLFDTDRGFPFVTAFLVDQTGFLDCLCRTPDQSQIPSWLHISSHLIELVASGDN